MRKTTTLLLFLGLLSITANAQMLKKKERFTIMPFLGASYLLGDMIPYGGNSSARAIMTELPNAIQQTRPSAGVWVGYRFHPKMTIRGGVSWMMYAESDKLFARNRNRGLNSKGSLTELNVHLVYDLIGMRTGGRNWSKWSPYLMAGVGVVYAQSNVTIDGVTDAASLAAWRNTFDIYNKVQEGSTVTISVPFGLGARYELTRGVDLHVEFMARFTPTDWLDGVEDYVNRQNDWFLTAQVGVTYQLFRQNSLFCPKPKTRKAKKFLLW